MRLRSSGFIAPANLSPGRGRGRRSSRRGRGSSHPAPAAPGAPGSSASGSSGGSSSSSSDSGSDSDSSSVQGQPLPLPLGHHNPLFEPGSDEEEMSPPSLPRYSGLERGSTGTAYLAAFDAFVGMSKWGQPSEALSRKLYALASGAEPGSVFDLWCHEHVRPLAALVAAATETCVTAADHQTVLTQYRPRYDAVVQLFKDTFCCPDVHEYRALMDELMRVCQAHVGGAVWRPLHHVLQKLQQFYSQGLPAGVLREHELVAQLLAMGFLPDFVSIRLQGAVEALPQAQLPQPPANAPANFNARHTFAAVLTAVHQLASQLDQTVGWGSLHFSGGHGMSGLGPVAPAMSQHSVSATSHLMQAGSVNTKAASLCAMLQHLSAEERCPLLARVYPDALCPEHCMLHALKVCPLAAEAERKAKSVVKHVHATLADAESPVAVEGVVKRVAQQFEAVIDARLSAFATGYHNRPRHDYDHRGGEGGYGHSRPIGVGHPDGYGSRGRGPPPVCAVCTRPGHSADNCFILHPEKCRDPQRLSELAVPEYLQGLFRQRLDAMRQAEGGPHGVAAEPLPGDVYPPRPSAQQHNMMHNHCTITTGLYPDDMLVVVEGEEEASAVVLATHGVAIPGPMHYGPEVLPSVLAEMQELIDAGVLVPVQVEYGDAGEAEPIVPEDMSESQVVSAATDSSWGPPELLSASSGSYATGGPSSEVSAGSSSAVGPHVPEPVSPMCVVDSAPAASVYAGVEDALVCACGSVCRLQLEYQGGEMGFAPVWQCPVPSSAACVAGVSAEGSSVVNTFVARYSGVMPASFRQADDANVNMVTRGVARAAAQAVGTADGAVGIAAPDPVQPVPVELPAAAVLDPAPVELPAAPVAPEPDAAVDRAQPPGSRSGGGRAARQPVSFAPDLATLYRQSVPGVPGLIEASVSNGFLTVPLGNVSSLFTPQARSQLGLEGARPPSSSHNVTSCTTHTFATAANGQVVSPQRRAASVCKLAQPEGRPSECMFVVSPDGTHRLPRVVYADSASDCTIIKASVARAYGLRLQELKGRTVHMSMVGGVFSQPTIITGATPMVFGRGGREMRVTTNLLVVDVEALPYDIILGTPLLQAVGAEIDFKAERMRVFPRWSRFRDASVSLLVPLCITSKAQSQGLPISPPVVAAAQAADSAKPATPAPVLCCAAQVATAL